jgi:hypothetical protein
MRGNSLVRSVACWTIAWVLVGDKACGQSDVAAEALFAPRVETGVAAPLMRLRQTHRATGRQFSLAAFQQPPLAPR